MWHLIVHIAGVDQGQIIIMTAIVIDADAPKTKLFHCRPEAGP